MEEKNERHSKAEITSTQNVEMAEICSEHACLSPSDQQVSCLNINLYARNALLFSREKGTEIT